MSAQVREVNAGPRPPNVCGSRCSTSTAARRSPRLACVKGLRTGIADQTRARQLQPLACARKVHTLLQAFQVDVTHVPLPCEARILVGRRRATALAAPGRPSRVNPRLTTTGAFRVPGNHQLTATLTISSLPLSACWCLSGTGDAAPLPQAGASPWFPPPTPRTSPPTDALSLEERHHHQFSSSYTGIDMLYKSKPPHVELNMTSYYRLRSVRVNLE